MAFKLAGAGMSFAAADPNAGLEQTSEAERQDQQRALSSLLGVLLAAGYFRARIPTLKPFDKVVGGLCWAISSSGAAVDVDLFYDEELALGQKIQLSEIVVTVLRSMGCTSPLQAHQIRGGDYVACFPVVQWIVKKVFEHRKITGDMLRVASEHAFDRRFARNASRTVASTTTSSSDLSRLDALVASTSRGAGMEYINDVEARYRPQRRYRRHISLWDTNMEGESRVQSCLLEFGVRTVVKATTEDAEEPSGPKSNEFERKFAAIQRAAKAEEEAKRKAAVELERTMLGQMMEAKAGVSGSSVGALVGLQSEEMRRAAEEYRQKEEELRALAESGDLLANTKIGRAAAHTRRVAAITKKIDVAEEALKVQQAELATVQNEIAVLQDTLNKAEKRNARAIAQIAKLDAQVDALPMEQKVQLKQLFDGYTRSEALKHQEERFKESCKQQLEELQERLIKLQSEIASGEGARRLAELTSIHEEATARLRRAKAVVAAKTREIGKLERLIDEVPSQAELLQYERRFMELFDLVAEKLDETRKYFATYNMLARKREYLAKEEGLIESMMTNFAALKNKSQRQAYLDQCAAIMSSIDDTLGKQTTLLESKKALRDAKQAELQRLIEIQRSYYKAVKEFQEECDKNDYLQAQFAAARAR